MTVEIKNSSIFYLRKSAWLKVENAIVTYSIINYINFNLKLTTVENISN